MDLKISRNVLEEETRKQDWCPNQPVTGVDFLCFFLSVDDTRTYTDGAPNGHLHRIRSILSERDSYGFDAILGVRARAVLYVDLFA